MFKNINRINLTNLIKINQRNNNSNNVRYFCKRYTESHEWIEFKDNKGRFGITNHAQELLGDMVFVQLPDVGIKLSAGEPASTVESVKAASEVYAPIDMEITSVNAVLTNEPEVINEDPEDSGWIAHFNSTDKSNFQKLLSKKQYEDLLKSGQ